LSTIPRSRAPGYYVDFQDGNSYLLKMLRILGPKNAFAFFRFLDGYEPIQSIGVLNPSRNKSHSIKDKLNIPNILFGMY